jgi:hypothetical protein
MLTKINRSDVNTFAIRKKISLFSDETLSLLMSAKINECRGMFLFSSFQLSCCMQSGVPMVSSRMKLNRNTKKEKVQETTASRSGLT